MKYMLFAWEDYHADGGMNDFRGLFNSVGEAEEHYAQIPSWPKGQLRDCGSGQIYCATSLQKVKDL